MGWSKVERGRKPLIWWYYKVMCELGWVTKSWTKIYAQMYYHYLNKCLKCGYNLYGKKMKNKKY